MLCYAASCAPQSTRRPSSKLPRTVGRASRSQPHLGFGPNRAELTRELAGPSPTSARLVQSRSLANSPSRPHSSTYSPMWGIRILLLDSLLCRAGESSELNHADADICHADG